MAWNSELLIYYILIYLVLFIILLNKSLKEKHANTREKTERVFQGGGEGIVVFILILGIIGLFLRRTNKRGQLQKAYDYLRSNQFNKALDIFIKNKKWENAAETILKSPPGTQILLLRQLQSHLSKARLKTLFLELGNKFQIQQNIQLAANAFELADLPWKAAQAHIMTGDISRALDVISNDMTLSRDRQRTVRNLAKFAFENNKILESADLLQSIGAEDEAVAVLVATGRSIDDLNIKYPTSINNSHSSTRKTTTPVSTLIPTKSKKGKQGTSQIDSERQKLNKSTSMPSPFALLRKQLHRAQIELQLGNIKESQAILNRSSGLMRKIPLSNSTETENLKKEFKRTEEAIRLLETARTAFKQKKIEDSQVSFSELLEFAGDLFSAEIFAEAGLAYEHEPADLEYAQEYFIEASTRASTAQAKKMYKERSESLANSLIDLPGIPDSDHAVQKIIFSPKDPCMVCKRPVGTERVVQCKHCQTAAHYPHLAEWLKIKGKCPVCKQKLTIQDIRIAEKA